MRLTDNRKHDVAGLTATIICVATVFWFVVLLESLSLPLEGKLVLYGVGAIAIGFEWLFVATAVLRRL